MSLSDRKPVQITHLAGDPVRSLSISRTDDLAFSCGGDLYRLRQGASEPERIDVNIVRADFGGDRASRTNRIDDFVLSPTGREIALSARGNIFVAAMNGKYVKRITHSPGEERTPSFSPDGRKLVYAGERDGHWSLFEARIADPNEKNFSEATEVDEKMLKAGDDDAMNPFYAPDGKHVAYVANRESVRALDVDSKAEVEILPKGRNYSYGDWSWWLSWSPDSKWVALPVQPSDFIRNIAVFSFGRHSQTRFESPKAAVGAPISMLSFHRERPATFFRRSFANPSSGMRRLRTLRTAGRTRRMKAIRWRPRARRRRRPKSARFSPSNRKAWRTARSSCRKGRRRWYFTDCSATASAFCPSKRRSVRGATASP
jgi:WD40 repeat protein